MPGVTLLARRLVAIATAAACLVLIAPPAAGDCCDKDCSGASCPLHQRSGHDRHGDAHAHGQAAAGHHGQGHAPAALHHQHRRSGSGPVWSGASMRRAAPCAAVCPSSDSRRAGSVVLAAASSSAPVAVDRLGTPVEQPARSTRPRHSAGPRAPPVPSSIVPA